MTVFTLLDRGTGHGQIILNPILTNKSDFDFNSYI